MQKVSWKEAQNWKDCMESRKETRSNEKVSKECGKGEHEEERHGAVLQAPWKHQELLFAALA